MGYIWLYYYPLSSRNIHFLERFFRKCHFSGNYNQKLKFNLPKYSNISLCDLLLFSKLIPSNFINIKHAEIVTTLSVQYST